METEKQGHLRNIPYAGTQGVNLMKLYRRFTSSTNPYKFSKYLMKNNLQLRTQNEKGKDKDVCGTQIGNVARNE